MTSVPNAYLGIPANTLPYVAAELEQKNTALAAMNVHLQKELEAEHALAEALGHEIEQANGKNTRLRELVEKLHSCARGALRDLAPSCVDESKDGCGMDCADNGEGCCMALLEQCMRELGIEVKK